MQELADGFHVGYQRLGGVVLQFGMGRGTPGAALIEDDDVVVLGIKVAPAVAVCATARAAVHEEHWNAHRIARLLHMQSMQGRHGQTMSSEGLYFGVENQHEDSSVR